MIGANGLPECYLRPIAFYGYGELGVAARGNPVEVVIMSWPWAPYLGEESLKTGIRAKISSWQRVSPNIVPHVSKATGVYLNSMLAVTEANNAGYDEAILLTPEGSVADGSGENIFIVRDGVIYTPDLATGILPGITRDTIKQIAQDLGYTVVEKAIIRSDLYLADEVFMCGTAAEVTPLRSIDDYEIGVGEVTLQIQKAYLDTVRGQQRALGAMARPRAADGAFVTDVATDRINLSAPWIDERDEELVLEVLRSGWLSLGPTGPRFESMFADAVGAPHCAAVSSGTAGLHLCMRLAGVGPGDEVITSPYSFVASANCAIYEGATPVFADIDPRTYNLDPAAVEAAITPRTKALVAVDIFGYPAEYDALIPLCEQHGIALVEDSCEALGATYKGKPLGSHGHPAVWAFYPNKQMTTGEGGAVTTGSEEEHELLVSLRNQGRLETSCWLQHGRLGYNYRLDDLSAALGIGQLEKLDRILAARREVAARYGELLARRRRRDAARGRRRPRALVVRLRRQAAGRRRPRRGDGAAVGAGDRDGAVPAVDPPAVVHARAVRVLGGDAAGERGLQRAHDGAAVPRAARARGPGARRRSAPRVPLGSTLTSHDGVPRLRQVRPRRPHLRHRAAARRRARLRRADARLGRGDPGGGDRIAAASGRSSPTWACCRPGHGRAPQDENLF